MVCGMALGFKAVCIYRDYEQYYCDGKGLVWLCFDELCNIFSAML